MQENHRIRHLTGDRRPNRRPVRGAVLIATLALGVVPHTDLLHAGDVKVDGKFVSTAATGTPPMAVNSTTQVSNFNADMVDGIHGAALARKLGNVVTVAKSGGEFTSIQAAIDSITTASLGSPWLVMVGPGEYFEHVTMKDAVSVVGSGASLTRIKASGGTFFGPAATVATAGNGAELRDLTILSDAMFSENYALGIYADGNKPNVHDVVVKVDGGTTATVGVFNTGGNLLAITDAVISAPTGADAIGVANLDTGLRLERSSVFGGHKGMESTATSGSLSVYIEHSTIGGPEAVVSDSEFTTNLYFSTISSGVLTANGGTFVCRFLVDGNGVAHTDTCP